jgi:diacylglycerol kinase
MLPLLRVDRYAISGFKDALKGKRALRMELFLLSSIVTSPSAL